MTIRERVHALVERLPEGDLPVLERMLGGLAQPEETQQAPLSPEERRALVKAARGSAAHLPGSVEQFLREKHEDNERDEARAASDAGH